MADIRALHVGNFTGVSPTSFFSVTVEDLEDAGAVRGLHVVLIRGPNWPSVFSPAHAYPRTTAERNSKAERLANAERGVFQRSDEASRFCEKQRWLLAPEVTLASKGNMSHLVKQHYSTDGDKDPSTPEQLVFPKDLLMVTLQ